MTARTGLAGKRNCSSTPKQRIGLAAQIVHYQARVQTIRRGEWKPYAGSFGAFLIHLDDGESTKPERLRRMRSILDKAIETSMSDQWVEIVDLPDNQVTGDCRRWYTLTWEEML